jgi:hypothetical protein
VDLHCLPEEQRRRRFPGYGCVSVVASTTF